MNPEKKNPRGGSRLGPETRTTREKKAKRPKRKLTRGQMIGRVVFLTATILSALIVVGYALWHMFSAPPAVDNLITPRPVTTTVIDEEGNEIELEIPGTSANRKTQFYTFLVIGQDTGGGGLTDTMLLGAYDVPNQKLSVMSLPRDTYVGYGSRTVLLNSIYNRAGGGADGISALKKEVGELTGVVPDFHVIVQWDAVGKLVDAIDGVYFEVPRNMNYDDPTQDLSIHIKKGYQLLNGKQAMGVIRYRHDNNMKYGYPDGDLGRIKTQQAFLKAVVEKCLQPNVLLPNLTEYINIFQENVETNLSFGNMAYFAKSAVGGLDMSDVEFVTLPNKGAGDAHLLPLAGEILEVVNQSFNPYDVELTRRNLNVVTRGPAGSGSSSGGAKPSPSQSQEPIEPTGTPAESGAPTQDPEMSQDPAASQDPAVSQDPAASQDPAQSPAQSAPPAQTPAQSPAQSAPPATAQPTPTPAPTPAPAAPTPDPNSGVILPPEAEGGAAA